jgi:hypothetical protein
MAVPLVSGHQCRTKRENEAELDPAVRAEKPIIHSVLKPYSFGLGKILPEPVNYLLTVDAKFFIVSQPKHGMTTFARPSP